MNLLKNPEHQLFYEKIVKGTLSFDDLLQAKLSEIKEIDDEVRKISNDLNDGDRLLTLLNNRYKIASYCDNLRTIIKKEKRKKTIRFNIVTFLIMMALSLFVFLVYYLW